MKIFCSVPAVWTGWICFRLILIGLLKWNYVPLGDISYYFSGRFGANSSDMTEYPPPGTWPSILVGWLSGPNQTSFTVIFTGLCLLVDAAFLMVLLHGWRRKPQAFVAAWFWVIFGTAVGQVFVWRLDIFPALAVAAAGVLLGRNSRLAAALLGLATTMKLWPGVLAAGLVGRFNARATWQRLSAFVASIVGICLLVIAFNDVERLISPLRYQEVRGLQVESIPATLPVFASHLFPDTWSISYAASKSFEITGPWVSALLVLSCDVYGVFGHGV
ncbi:glycosyltransferase 87 family protein [Corynebacterium striatum]|uniref:glycosyltransferase 87 family protein n=1 Tax=Corynebacterium striatum TaxID=43770 RepID=UPI0027B9CBEA|nr:glycosyltransferase 87 family protein [Corynebacterium striatum]